MALQSKGVSTQVFMDVRNYRFFRVAAASPIVHLADPMACATEHLNLAQQAYAQGAQLIVFPELGMSGGYSLQDLHFDWVVQKQADTAIEWFLDQTKDLNAIIVFGSTIVVGDMLFNGAYVVLKGQVLGVVIKTSPPNYGEFTEERWFRGAEELPYHGISKFGQDFPVGNDLLFESSSNPDIVIGGEVCEDGWLAISPSKFLALKGAKVIFNISGSNYTVGKQGWRYQIGEQSAFTLTGFIYAGAGPTESTTGMVFDSPLLIYDRGAKLKEGELFADNSFVIADLDLGAIAADRMRMNSWAHNARQFRDVLPARTVIFDGELGIEDLLAPVDVYGEFQRDFDPDPFLPKNDQELARLHMARVVAIKTRLSRLPQHLRKIIIGLSGGKDSTSILMQAHRVVELYGQELGMSHRDIIGVTMPGFGTSEKTYDYASELGRVLGISYIEVPITVEVKALLKAIGISKFEDLIQTGNPVLSLLFENSQAWVRKDIEKLLAALKGGIVLGSTSASEAFIGWGTFHGDMAAHYAPNMSVGKSVIPVELEWLASTIYTNSPELAKLLRAIARSASSPELLPLSDSGTVVQKSEEINGPDRVRDFYAYHLLRFYRDPVATYRMALQTYQEVYTSQELYRWLYRFIDRLNKNWFKVNMQATDGPVLGLAPKAHDPIKRPSDVSPKIWLQRLEDCVPLPLRSFE